eukprot:5178263-Amphidinium_carterae.1
MQLPKISAKKKHTLAIFATSCSDSCPPRYAVDRHNLKWGVYGQGAGAGRLAVKAACDVPLTVAGCWAQWALVAMLAPRQHSTEVIKHLFAQIAFIRCTPTSERYF